MSYNGRLTSLSHGGGCGCKIAPGILSDILKASPIRNLPAALLAGSDNNEDAAVYQITIHTNYLFISKVIHYENKNTI